jgi:hypothetical protein
VTLPGTWLACTMGITPCINSHTFTGKNHGSSFPRFTYMKEKQADNTYKFPRLFLITELGEQPLS